jgi:tetratricopeptide (TPR) repeat protein
MHRRLSSWYLDYAGTEALHQLAQLEGDGSRKLEILAEAVTIAEEGNVIQARVSPFFTWNIGVGYISEGSLRYDIAGLMREQAKRRELLGVAVSRFRAGFGKIRSYPFPLSSGQVLRLGDFYLRFVSALDNLYKETAEQSLLEEQIQALTLASDAYSSAQYPARVSEALWHRAGVYSRKGDHRVAAQDYSQAAERFRAATTAMPNLGGLYHDLEKYMQAWCDIEGARASHAEGLYREASETYRRASYTLKDTQRWSHLSEHYSACSLLEGAEALSHEENPELASQAFIEAAAGFAGSKRAISEWRASGEGEEKEKDRWGIVAGTRERYCGSRSVLE